MKKLTLIFALAVAMISNQYVYANNEQSLPKKTVIINAIKKSRPDLLQEHLKLYRVTKQDKDEFLDIASHVIKIRETKMYYNLIKPKCTTTLEEGLALISFALGASSAATSTFFLGYCLCDNLKDGDVLIPTGLVALGLSVLFIKIGNFLMAESKPVRTRKQKYLAAVEVKHLLNRLSI